MKTKKIVSESIETTDAVALIPQSAEKMRTFPCYEIPLELIDPNPNNPRTYFGDEELLQMAATIERYGVIQPVLVYPVKNEQTGITRFTLVHGERRTRASIIAGKSTIPAFIRELETDQIKALAVLENIQRVNISEFELANVFYKMQNEENKEIVVIADAFGVSPTFVRNRILLLELIDELRALVDEEAITISMALELCKYNQEIQTDVYEKHLKANCEQSSWRPLKKAEFVKKMVETYSMELDGYSFSKEDCNACAYNTGRQKDLFGDVMNCRCMKPSCLMAKVNINLYELIMTTIEGDPLLSVAIRSKIYNKEVVDWLKKSEIKIREIDYSNCYFDAPRKPTEPTKEQFPTDQKMEIGQKQYQAALETYQSKMAEVAEKISAGKLKCYLLVRDRDFMYVYEDLEQSAKQIEDPVKTLQIQDESNLENARGNIIKNTVKVFHETKVPVTDITASEEKYLYLAMLDSIRNKFLPLLRFKQIAERADDTAKIAVINKLSSKQKILIKRVFLMSALSMAGPDSPRYALLEEFAQTFYPDQFAEIKERYMEQYAKRHSAIEAKIAEIRPSETSGQTPDDPVQENQPDTEPSQQTAADGEQTSPTEPLLLPAPAEEPAQTQPESMPAEAVPDDFPEPESQRELEDWEKILIESEPEEEDPFKMPEPSDPKEPRFTTRTPQSDQPAA